MIVLRLLSLLIFSALLTGCTVSDDIKALKAELKALKAYLSAFPPPKSCPPPGKEPDWKCHYELDITRVVSRGEKDKGGVFEGKVAADLVSRSAKYCKEQAKKDNLDPALCADPARYVYQEFTFTVDGDTTDLNDKTTKARFYSTPGSTHLKRIKS